MKWGREWWKPLLEPEWSPAVVLAAAVLLGIVGNAGYDLLQLALRAVDPRLATPVAAGLAGLAGLGVLMGGFWLYSSLVRGKVDVSEVRPQRGLIALVSDGAHLNAAETAIWYHLGQNGAQPARLTHCYLISDRPAAEGQEPPHSSYANALQLQEKYKPRLIVCEVLPASEKDCQDIMGRCEEAWRLLRAVRGLRRQEIIADATGASKRMTIGMVLSAVRTGCPLEYLERLQPQPQSFEHWHPQRISLRFFLRHPWEREGDD